VLAVSADNNLGASASTITLDGGTFKATAGFTDTHAFVVGAAIPTTATVALGASGVATLDLGGLAKLVDVHGNSVPITVVPSGATNSVETTTDLFGNTTEEIYNPNGQLLSKIQGLQDPLNPAVTQYNSGRVILQSNPFFSDEADRFTAGLTARGFSPLFPTYPLESFGAGATLCSQRHGGPIWPWANASSTTSNPSSCRRRVFRSRRRIRSIPS
jgi:hypothetical protein